MGLLQQQQQNPGGQQMQGTSNWMSQLGQQQNGQAPNGMLHNQSMLGMQQPQQQQPQAQMNGQQHANQNPSLASPFNPNLVPYQSHSAPTPLQQFSNEQQALTLPHRQRQWQQTSPQPPSTGGSIGGMGGPKQPMTGTPIPGQQTRSRDIAMPPIPRDKFSEMLNESYKRTNANPDRRLLVVGNRQIDLYQLHIEVLHFGGVVNVSHCCAIECAIVAYPLCR